MAACQGMFPQLSPLLFSVVVLLWDAVPGSPPGPLIGSDLPELPEGPRICEGIWRVELNEFIKGSGVVIPAFIRPAAHSL
ncbi:unnamed protein product [Gadus morhua 'NCC']